MEVLLKRFGEEYYVWKEADYRQGKYFFANTNTRIEQTNILAIRNDNREGYVKCANCGEIIHNDPQSIESHFAGQEAKRDCFNCERLRQRDKIKVNTKYEKNDGYYTITETANARLTCGLLYWNAPDIDSEEAKKNCIFTACRRAGVSAISDVFVKYPNLFDKQATVDTLNGKNSTYEEYARGFFIYDLKCHGAVKAYVNPLGIISHFTISYRSHVMTAFYSARYDKLFFSDCREYSENAPYDISDSRYNQAKAKISALYKEA